MKLEISYEITSEDIWNFVMFTLITLFFLYSFWYQQAVASVGGAFVILGGSMLAMSLLHPYELSFYSELYPIFAFIATAFVQSMLFSQYRAKSLQTLFNCVEYMLPMFAIFVYISGSREKLRKVLWSLMISMTLLSIAIYLNPSIGNTGAVTIGEMNVNVLSSLITMGLIVGLTLLMDHETSKIKRIVLIVYIVLLGFTQINTASRRGFIVFVMVIALAAGLYVQIRFSCNLAARWFTIAVLVICGVLILVMLLESLGDSALLLRLTGQAGDTAEGDRLRGVYQAAAWDLFLENPLFGGGINSVAGRAGVYSHSLYYELLGCTGIVGTFLILGFWVGHSISIFLIYKRQQIKDTQVSYSCLSGSLLAIAVLASGFAVVQFYDMYFYVMLALMASMKKIIVSESGELLAESKLPDGNNDKELVL